VNYLEVGFHVADFMTAFWGALIVSVVSSVLSSLLEEKD
jgi:uncharacterized membrane protein YvlD (DUF360 family)